MSSIVLKIKAIVDYLHSGDVEIQTWHYQAGCTWTTCAPLLGLYKLVLQSGNALWNFLISNGCKQHRCYTCCAGCHAGQTTPQCADDACSSRATETKPIKEHADVQEVCTCSCSHGLAKLH
eukprot:1514743-Amphidinium_carterae.1